MIPARYIAAGTVLLLGVLALIASDLWAWAVATEWCAKGCGDRLDYVVRGECSCLPPEDAPAMPVEGGAR